MVWKPIKWRETWNNHEGSVLSTTVGKVVAVGPFHTVVTKEYTGHSRQNPTYKSRTFKSNCMKENKKGGIDAANSLLDLTTNGKDISQKCHEECDTKYKLFEVVNCRLQVGQGILSNLSNTSQLQDEAHRVENRVEGIVTLTAYMIIQTKWSTEDTQRRKAKCMRGDIDSICLKQREIIRILL